MKKIMILMAVLLMASFSQAAKYVSVGVVPDTNNIASVTQNFTAGPATPVAVYTELTGTTTNAVTITFTPSVATNAADYGKSYRVGSFSTVGGAEATIVLNDALNTNSAGNVIQQAGDVLTLTGEGGTDRTNVFYRVLYRID